jgi:Ca2+-binding RTX toxin-like protein
LGISAATGALGSGRPADVVLSADGTKVYASYADGFIRVYDVATGTLVDSWDVGMNLGGMDLSPDGTFLVVTERQPLADNGLSGSDRRLDITVYKVDVATGQAISYPYVAGGFETTFFDAEILADGTVFLSQGYPGSGSIQPKLLNLGTGAYTILPMTISQDTILTGADDGSFVFMAEANNSGAMVRLYETGVGFVATQAGSGYNRGVQAYSAEAGLAAHHLYGGGGVIVYDQALQFEVNLTSLHQRWAHGGATDLAFDSDGSSLFVLDNDTDTIVEISTSDWSIIREIPVGVNFGATEIGWLGDYGNRLLVGPDNSYFTIVTDDGLRLVANPFVLNGTEGDDTYVGTTGDDMIFGNGGNDDLAGNGGDDEIDGGEGNDFITVGPGIHDLDGGAGTDTLRLISPAPDEFGYVDGYFVDLVDGELKRWFEPIVSPAVGFENVSGSQGDDQISGTGDVNILAGEEGHDFISGGSGNDLLLGDGSIRFADGQVVVTETGVGSGGDVLHGEDGDDRIVGGAGEDFMTGGVGNDLLEGGEGDDALRGDFGDDVIDGGAGIDRVSYAHSNTIGGVTMSLEIQGVPIDVGAFGMDTLISIENLNGSRFSDHLTGDDGDNYISGTASVFAGGSYIVNDDMLFGLGGDDLLAASIGDQSLDGGAGIDTATVVDTSSNIPYSGEVYTGTTLSLELQESAQASGFGNWTLKDIENLSGGLGNDQLTGNGQVNVLAGGAGNDVLSGGSGNDVLLGDGQIAALSGGTITTSESFSYAFGDAPGFAEGDDILDGGEGDDRMVGGRDDDLYYVDSLGDVVVEQAGEGTDEVRTGLSSYGLALEVENLTGTSGAGQTLSGNSKDNVITGAAGNDMLVGGSGNDIVRGGGGADQIYGGVVDPYAGAAPIPSGNDVLEGGDGADWINAWDGDDMLDGGADNDILLGGAGNDVLDGGLGADSMTGGSGNDIYHVDNAGDTVTELDFGGIDEVRTSLGSKAPPDRAVYVLPDFVENLIGTSAGAQGVGDNSLDNVITMGAGHDLVVADAGGVDTISGGGGNDFFYHGDKLTAADVTNGGAGTDTIALLGDYGAGITFTASNLVGVERMALYTSLYLPGTGPNNYAITMNDANVAAGTEFFVTAASLQSNESLIFNGSAETDGRFTVHGGGGADTIIGGAGGDFVIGNAGNDTLYGLGGLDFLIGGLGADQLRGGAGGDRFVYQSTAQSTTGSIDHILDFQHVDRIDLSGIDANGNAADGNSAFTFIGSNAFGNVAGQLRAYQSGADWFVEGDTNGDGLADLIIKVTLPDATPIGAADFIL